VSLRECAVCSACCLHTLIKHYFSYYRCFDGVIGRQLLFDTPEEKFVQLQLKAVRARVSNITLEL